MRQVLKEAMHALLYKQYLWGGDDPLKGFDCSGVTQELLATVGMDPPGDQTAQSLYNYFNVRSVAGLRALGALIFYGESALKISHVAMFYDESLIFEAGGGGSKTTSFEAAAQQNAYNRIRPYNLRKDIVAILMPPYLDLFGKEEG